MSPRPEGGREVPVAQDAEVLASLSRGALTLEEALAIRGRAGDEARAWAQAAARGALTRQARARRSAWRKGLVSAAVALVAASSLWISRQAWAASCAQTLPAPLVTFCPNEPALAAQINGNFQQLVTWLEAKVGPVGTPLSGAKLAAGSVSNAQLEPVLACPNSTRATWGVCLFMTTSTYTLTFREAAVACKNANARLCTRAELSYLQAAGYPDSCTFGWLADRVDSNNAYIGYPMQTPNVAGCGMPGINENMAPVSARFANYCCK